jgi:hypothetical protein
LRKALSNADDFHFRSAEARIGDKETITNRGSAVKPSHAVVPDTCNPVNINHLAESSSAFSLLAQNEKLIDRSK